VSLICASTWGTDVHNRLPNPYIGEISWSVYTPEKNAGFFPSPCDAY
jgi:hypothetical protein